MGLGVGPPTCARASCGLTHATAPCCQRGSSWDELMSGSVNSAALLAFVRPPGAPGWGWG